MSVESKEEEYLIVKIWHFFKQFYMLLHIFTQKPEHSMSKIRKELLNTRFKFLSKFYILDYTHTHMYSVDGSRKTDEGKNKVGLSASQNYFYIYHSVVMMIV